MANWNAIDIGDNLTFQLRLDKLCTSCKPVKFNEKVWFTVKDYANKLDGEYDSFKLSLALSSSLYEKLLKPQKSYIINSIFIQIIKQESLIPTLMSLHELLIINQAPLNPHYKAYTKLTLSIYLSGSCINLRPIYITISD